MPAKIDMTIYQGATFSQRFTYKAGKPPVPVDLTGVTARMHIREEVDSLVPLVELTSSNGKLFLGGTSGTISMVLTATETSGYQWTAGVYDLELAYSDGRVVRLFGGKIKVSKEVTR